MAAPLIVAGASWIVSQIATSAWQALVKPSERVAHYFSNASMPSLLPDIDALMRLYHCGYVDANYLSWSMRMHGASVRGSAHVPGGTYLWQRVVRLARNKPAAADVLNLWLRKDITKDKADERLKELGFSVKEERDLLLGMYERLPLGVIQQLYNREQIDKDQALEKVRRLGFIDQEEANQLLELPPPLAMLDVMQAWHRGYLTEQQYHDYIRRAGIRDNGDRLMLRGLSQYIPPVTDLVRFVIKDVFSDELVAKWGLDEEYNEQKERYEFWCKAQGLGEMTLPGSPNGEFINWPKMYYRSAWQLTSPTQGYIFLHRFRPERLHKYRGIAPNIKEFSPDDAKQLLKANDYPVPLRDWLVASSYNVITRVDARRMYDVGALGSKVPDGPFDATDPSHVAASSAAARELTAIYQDQGYVRSDAEKLSAFTVMDARRKQSGRILGQSRAVIADAYRVGMISADEAAIRLYRMRFENPEQRVAFDNLPRVEQERLARADPEVIQGIVHLDFQADLQLVKEHIKSVKAAYISGRTSRDMAEVALRRLGVAMDRIERYLTLWDSQRSGSRKLFTVDKLVRYARAGFLNEADLRARLANLGYQLDDINLIVAGTQRDIALDVGRVAERQARTEAQRQAAVARQIREQERRLEQDRKRLAKLSTAAQLATWVERGIVSPDQMLARLVGMGVSEVDAQAKVTEAVQRFAERQERRARQRQQS